MMSLLLDSHVLLWTLVEDDRVPHTLSQEIADPRNAVHVSAATIWELGIKAADGRLGFDHDLVEYCEGVGFALLPIRVEDCVRATRLPIGRHRDPFDRMLVAQAQGRGLTLVTADHELDDYDVDVIAVP